MSVTGHIIGNWNLSGEVNDSGGSNVVPNPPEEATDTLEKVGIDDVVYSITGEQEQADWDQSDPTAVDYIKNKPTIPAAQVNSDWDAESGVAEILNKPTLSAVATSGSYTDLTDTPTIPAAQVNSDWDAASGVAQILNKPSLSTVATSGDYDDLINKPTIPAAQVNSDWNAASGVAQILNKPTLATVATSGEAEDVSYDNTVSGMTATDVQAAVDELKSNLIVLSPTTTSTITGLTSSSSAQDFIVQEAGFYQFYSQHNSGVQGEIKLANGNSETLWIIQNKNQNFSAIIASPIFYLKAGTYKLTIQGTSCGYRKYTL